MSKTLSDTHRVILAAAAARNSLRVLPFPTSLNKNQGSLTQIVSTLVAAGLLAQVTAEPGEQVWSRKEGEQAVTLVITTLGLEAIGVAASEETSGSAVTDEIAPSQRTPRPGSKLHILIAQLSRREGAGIEELVRTTGWQKHSVRGAISGALKNTYGLTVLSELVEGRGRVYRITVVEAQSMGGFTTPALPSSTHSDSQP